MELMIQIGALYCLAFAAFHLAFWRLFRWKTQLAKLHENNRALMQVMNLRLTYVLLVFGLTGLFFTEELRLTMLGNFLLGAVSLFWLGRAIEQAIFWKFDTVSASFFVVFLLGSAIFAVPLVWR